MPEPTSPEPTSPEPASGDRLRVTVLGSGSSAGVPVAAQGWGKCDPAEPRNRRRRASVLVEGGGAQVLIDTSPDLRAQLLDAEITHLDAVLYTHAHADHLHGIDDLRAVNQAMKAPIPAYADAVTHQTIAARFGYTLTPLEGDVYFKPVLTMTDIAPGGRVQIGGLEALAFDQDHGRSRTLGWRIGNFAYSTDVVALPDAAFEALADLDVWYLGVFTDQPHETHIHLQGALKWIERVRPRRAILGHLGPDLCYRALSAQLPPGVEAAWDGMTFDAAL
ncbi:MAG: MBL fold metallo-hydrolase [Rhodospirillales bacterium]